MLMNNAERRHLPWVSGKVSNARHEPMFSKPYLYLLNTPVAGRWGGPQPGDSGANAQYERTGEWIERIGWPRFFKLADIPSRKSNR
jgi:sulfite reductase beta subunit